MTSIIEEKLPEFDFKTFMSYIKYRNDLNELIETHPSSREWLIKKINEVDRFCQEKINSSDKLIQQCRVMGMEGLKNRDLEYCSAYCHDEIGQIFSDNFPLPAREENIFDSEIDKLFLKYIDISSLIAALYDITAPEFYKDEFDLWEVKYRTVLPLIEEAYEVAATQDGEIEIKKEVLSKINYLLPRDLNDIFFERPKLQIINMEGKNEDLRSRKEEYAWIFGIPLREIEQYSSNENAFWSEHKDLDFPAWVDDYSPIYSVENKSGYVTYRDLVNGIMAVKSGKIDRGYEAFSSATIHFPNENTVLIKLSFHHGS